MQSLAFIVVVAGLSGGVSHASDEQDTHAAEPNKPVDIVLPTPQERLTEAVHIYQTGSPKNAQVLLASIVNDSSYDDEPLRQRARTFLGEVLYLQQSEEEARRIFEAVLTLEPNYVMDPFEHPPDVCGFFETIRAYIRPQEDQGMAMAAPVPPTPFNAYLGFGLYQLRHKERSLGISMAIGQTTFGLISAAMFAGLLDDRSFTSGVDDERQRVQRRKATQWAATTGFYGFWAWSAIDANRHWRTNVEMHTVSAKSNRGQMGGLSRIQVQFTFPTR